MTRRYIPFAVFLLCSALTSASQTGQPVSQPTPAPKDGGVVKISTSLIQIDVSVTDKKGSVVPDLRAEEIEIFENGQKQKITGFSFVANVRKTLTPDKLGKSAIPEPPLVLRPEQVRRTIALVVDDLTLSFESAAYTRRALKKFVDDQMQDGDLVGIIRTGAGIGALQQFTSNKQQLYAAIERVKWNAAGRGRFGSFDPVEPTMSQTRRSAGDPYTTPADIQAERDFNDSANNFIESLFTTGTLGALKYIVGNMGELPGRKSVILFSDGFQIFPGGKNPLGAARLMTDERGELYIPSTEGSMLASQTLDFMRELIALANRKSVIFYTLDARGLQTTGITAADRIADPTTLDFTALNSMQQIESDRGRELFNTQQGLVYLAKQTGGFAYVNQNRMSEGVQKALDDQSYYLVAYEPDQDSFDPEKRKFNKLEVKVLRDNTNVRHRSGFFVEKESEAKVKIDLNTPTKIMRALTSPFAVNEINLRLNALFGYSPKRGYYVHSFIHINAADLEFSKMPNGDLQSNFDILAVSYGDNGAPVDKENLVGTIKLRPEVYERLKDRGIAYSFIFPVKKPGAYQMRVALMDRKSKEVGSANQFVEVPNLKKNGILLSGILLENLTLTAWQKLGGGPSQVNANAPVPPYDEKSDPLQDTSLRRFKRGTVLRFGTEIYNAKLPSLTQAKINIQARVFHDRELVFETKEQPINAEGQNITEPVYTDAVQLGENLLPGDYVLQIVVTDGLAKDKKRIATQYVQFEVVE